MEVQHQVLRRASPVHALCHLLQLHYEWDFKI